MNQENIKLEKDLNTENLIKAREKFRKYKK